MVELEIGHRLGSGGVEGASLLCVVERRAARGGERRWRGGELEMLEDLRHAGRLGNKCDETHRVAAIGPQRSLSIAASFGRLLPEASLKNTV